MLNKVKNSRSEVVTPKNLTRMDKKKTHLVGCVFLVYYLLKFCQGYITGLENQIFDAIFISSSIDPSNSELRVSSASIM